MTKYNMINHDDHAADALRYFFMSMPRDVREKMRRQRRMRKIAIALLSATITILVVIGIKTFFQNYAVRFHFPVTIERIHKAEPTKALPTPTPTPEPTKAAAPQVSSEPRRVAYFIWTTETGRGNAHSGWQKTCEDRGKWNEIGYGGDGYCFESEAEGMAHLTRELTARIAKNGLKETLCVYNKGFNRNETGERIPWADCSYYQSYINSL